MVKQALRAQFATLVSVASCSVRVQEASCHPFFLRVYIAC